MLTAARNALIVVIMFISHSVTLYSEFKDNHERIYFGYNCSTKSYPFMVRLMKKHQRKIGYCAGTLITGKWVLTAAHCIHPEDTPPAPMFIVAAIHEYKIKVRVINTIQHPSFQRAVTGDDIALLELEFHLRRNIDDVDFVKLPTEELNWSIENAADLIGQIMGWGYIRENNVRPVGGQLQCAYIPIISLAECRGLDGYENVDNNSVCTLSVEKDRIDACNGDSGGPLLYDSVQCDLSQDTDDEGVEVGSPYGYGGSPNQITKENSYEDETHARLAVLSYEQICRLNDVMEETVCIVGRGNFPTLEVRLRDLVDIVRAKLEGDPTAGGAGMRVKDIRLNGGAASHVLAAGQEQPYNDVDLIFGVELSSARNFDKVKAAVLSSLYDMLPDGVSRKRISTCSLKEAYVSKMVKVNNPSDSGDRWSLISLGCQRGRGVELKFVDRMRRQFEFSVDSFQIVLDSLLLFYQCASGQQKISENFYPTVVGESVYGDFREALRHLQKRLISTRRPEEIRGGGLLKYCTLLVKNYRPAHPDYIRSLERYMCSRFFIDFPDVEQQRSKLETYLWNHFGPDESGARRHRFLLLLHDVVAQSTVCLMGHERRQTLQLIKSFAWQVLYQDHAQQQQQQQAQHLMAAPTAAPAPPLVIANGYVYAPITIATPPCQFCGCGSTWMTCCSTT